MARASSSTKRARHPKAVSPRPVLQWLAAAVGLVITLGAGGVILAEALQPSRPVALSVRVQDQRRTAESRILELVVTNSGSKTAAAVDVVGKIAGETATATIDYVPGNGEASASLAFPIQAAGQPVVSVAGWTDP